MNNMRAFTAFMMLAALAATSGSLSAAEAKRTFKLHQDKPVLVDVDFGAKGHTNGDMLAFEAKVSGENGLKGHLYGLLITVDIANGDDKFEDRSGQIFVDFGNGNSLVVAGRSVYAATDQEIQTGVPQVRAVIGGTGDYMGTRGQVTTVRNEDGSYDHTVELAD